jgi:hypothetical protein
MNIDKLGNGVGKLYVTEPDGTTYIYNDLTNDADGTITVKYHGLTRSSEGFPISATGSVDFGSIGANDSVSSLTINSIEQIDISSPIAITIGGELQAAIDVAAAVNSHTPVSGVNYRAYAVGIEVVMESTPEAGSSVNGHTVVITVGIPASQSIGVKNVSGGSEGGELISAVIGARYFLDATEAAVPNGVGSPGTEEITQYIVMRGVQSQHYIQTQTIATDAIIDLPRFDRFSVLELGAGANTDLTSITGDFANNDILVLQNTSAFTVTVKDLSLGSGNIKLNPTSFEMTDDDQILWIMYMDDATDGRIWREIYRNPATVGVDAITSTELAALSVGTTELKATSVTAVKIALLAITNALMATNSVDTANIIDDAITEVKILNGVVTEDKIGALAVTNGKIEDGAVGTSKIGDDQVTLAKLEGDVQKGFFVINTSWETGFEGGLIKYEVPFALQVDKISACVTKLIEATDDATLIPKNHAGTAMTAGQIDLTGGALVGNVFDSSPTANNTFTSNESIGVEQLKSTVGGEAQVTIHYTRL